MQNVRTRRHLAGSVKVRQGVANRDVSGPGPLGANSQAPQPDL